MPDQLPFVKMSGAGNDFIVFDEADCQDINPGQLAARLCTRALSIGADGLIIVGPASADGVQIRFFNPDGSLAEMCGNGSRCAARYAVDHGLAPRGPFRLLTDSGDLNVIVRQDGRYEVAMPEPRDIQFELMAVDIDGETATVHAVRVGVPHAVVILSDVDRYSDDQLTQAGRMLRHHSSFPDGVNTNFITRTPGEAIRQRTYERGVENLTKACGTGSTASAFMSHKLLGVPWPIDLVVDGGRLTIQERDNQLWLIGDARVVATGRLGPDALTW